MKEISLCGGYITKVDDADYERCMKITWTCCLSGVRQSSTNLPMSNFILEVEEGMVDHKDRNNLNNQRNNLRFCDGSQNQANRVKFRKNTSSKYKGVYFYKAYSKWRALIMRHYKNRHLGYFASEIEAALAYDKKAKELFGEFAVLNFPDGQPGCH